MIAPTSSVAGYEPLPPTLPQGVPQVDPPTQYPWVLDLGLLDPLVIDIDADVSSTSGRHLESLSMDTLATQILNEGREVIVPQPVLSYN
jgi:hypothetical protein